MLDFGLAKLTLSDQKVSHKTRTGSVMGTPYYMSPEQCEGKIEIDHRADIYSLGVLLFEMLTGKVPFGGDGYGEIIVKHVTMPPPSVRSINDGAARGAGPDPVSRAREGSRSALPDDGEFEEALRDPQNYASSAPVIGIPDDLSGVARAASPMARSEMDARSKIGFGSGLAIDRPPGGIPSTFREGRGELIDRLIPQEEGRHARPSTRASLFLAGGGRRHVRVARRRQQAAAAGGARARFTRARCASTSTPIPDGAIVLRGDGKTLGLTPLSIEVPYSDSAVEFQFRKAGFEKKTVYVVPNLPSPLFATLRKIEVRARGAVPPQPADAAGRRRVIAAAQTPKKQKPADREAALHNDDEDGTLEPSFNRP